ncbi:MAG: MBL fold metallo-hydrolase [Rhodospirillales bacterium]
MPASFENGGLETVAEGVHVYVGPKGDSNNGIVTTDDGTISIDSHIKTYDAYMTAYKKVATKPVCIAINTHDDGDHFSLNHLFRRDGATILASETCRARIETKMQQEGWVNDLRKRNPAMAHEITNPADFIPHVGVHDTATLKIAGEKIDLIHMGHGHCPGDMVVHFPERGVLFTGDLVFAGVHGRMKTTDVEQIIAILDKMLTIPCETVVPGHGAPIKGVNRESIETYKHYTISMRDRVTELVKNGGSEDQLEAEFKDWQYKDWGRPHLLPICIQHVYKDVVWRTRFGVEDYKPLDPGKI